ncbi:MAG: hypothetical protein Q9167_004712 [Letrouitia subvulpina]
MGISEAYQQSAISNAFGFPLWPEQFYDDKDVKAFAELKVFFAVIQTIVDLELSASALMVPIVFNGALGVAQALIPNRPDDTYKKTSQLGGILQKLVDRTFKALIEANNQLMLGQNFRDTGDIRKWIGSGNFINSQGVNKIAVGKRMDNLLLAKGVNILWRKQMIFILGGVPCDYNSNAIGRGGALSACIDRERWFLYYWKGSKSDWKLDEHNHWGWVEAPKGSKLLGTGAYSGVTVEDVIRSSVATYKAGGYNYDEAFAQNQIRDAIAAGRQPGLQGPSWEGIFTIPVCEVGWAIDPPIITKDKQYILSPYGGGMFSSFLPLRKILCLRAADDYNFMIDYRPHWCGDICKADKLISKQFREAANMKGYDSPTRPYCKWDYPY